MTFYLVDDDSSVLRVLENIIEEYDLGEVVGKATDSEKALGQILSLKPAIVVVDMLMPAIDGCALVKTLKDDLPDTRFVMLSQVSSKNIISKAYDCGVEFFISKPVNQIEIRNVLGNIKEKLEMERTFKLIEGMFNKGVKVPSANLDNGDELQEQIRKIRMVFSKLGILGEKGGEDLLQICAYMLKNNLKTFDFRVRDICDELCDNPKAMEQRLRRAINRGLINLANLGIEDYMNENFIRFSGTLYDFESVKAEMDYIRGKRDSGGKISVRKFIDNLILMILETA
ncbi:response regulator [Acidaminobacter hydrogenoformans]|uniref:Stage 0 sporulation protein A homolog n=1 Tax=Acidaminobacter hydrogenoformans DSM 2784 TaxID=1120920 RepID=A0A1G5RX53_9FIRM|nr:response regulator [Acidaminobacter hydrogenoformans]SCZ78330.1 two-component system, response regulator YcbB [Acidaminobacter hydrogenoformans DSM 2784]